MKISLGAHYMTDLSVLIAIWSVHELHGCTTIGSL